MSIKEWIGLIFCAACIVVPILYIIIQTENDMKKIFPNWDEIKEE